MRDCNLRAQKTPWRHICKQINIRAGGTSDDKTRKRANQKNERTNERKKERENETTETRSSRPRLTKWLRAQQRGGQRNLLCENKRIENGNSFTVWCVHAAIVPSSLPLHILTIDGHWKLNFRRRKSDKKPARTGRAWFFPFPVPVCNALPVCRPLLPDPNHHLDDARMQRARESKTTKTTTAAWRNARMRECVFSLTLSPSLSVYAGAKKRNRHKCF